MEHIKVCIAELDASKHLLRNEHTYEAGLIQNAINLLQDKVNRYDIALEASKRSPKDVIQMRFCHDLEDGWYEAKLPDGTTKTFDSFATFRNQLQPGDVIHWADTNTYYMPASFNKEFQVYIN